MQEEALGRKAERDSAKGVRIIRTIRDVCKEINTSWNEVMEMPFHLVCAIIRDINDERAEQNENIDEEKQTDVKRYELPPELKRRGMVER